MSKTFTMIVAILVTISISIPELGLAKSFGSRSFSSSSFSRSTFRSSSFSSSKSKSYSKSGSFWGGSKKTTTTTKQPTKKFTTNSSGGSKVTASKSSSFKKVSAGTQTRSAKTALNRQRNKFKQKSPVTAANSEAVTQQYKTKYRSNPVYSRASSYDRNTYYTRRNRYYSSYEPPMYVYNMSPSYGLWDTIFLYSMLINMNNASQFAHNHQNDADYLMWRREAEKQAQTNAELRAQLARLDAKTNALAGQAIDPSYLPKGVDADIALSQEALVSQKPTFKVCVGSKSGAYFRIAAGVMSPGQNVVNMVPVITAGSREVLEKVSSGECDGGFVQGDSYWNYVEANQTTHLPFKRVFTPFKEAVHMVCNAKSGIKDVNDMSKKTQVYFPTKSGAAETWTNFVVENNDYSKIQTSLNNSAMVVDSNEEAMLKASQDKNACALYVAVPGATQIMRKIENGAKASNIVLINMNDSSMVKTTDPSGNEVYQLKKLTKDTYPNLLRKAGVLSTSYFNSIKTPHVNTDFIVSDKWKTDNKTAYGQLAVDLLGMKPEISAVVHQ